MAPKKAAAQELTVNVKAIQKNPFPAFRLMCMCIVSLGKWKLIWINTFIKTSELKIQFHSLLLWREILYNPKDLANSSSEISFSLSNLALFNNCLTHVMLYLLKWIFLMFNQLFVVGVTLNVTVPRKLTWAYDIIFSQKTTMVPLI